MRVKHGVKSKYGDSKFSTKFKFSTAVYYVVLSRSVGIRMTVVFLVLFL